MRFSLFTGFRFDCDIYCNYFVYLDTKVKCWKKISIIIYYLLFRY